MADPIATQAPPRVPQHRPNPEQHGDAVPRAGAGSEAALNPSIDRIELALGRIEVATRKRAEDSADMERRHAALRKRMIEAIATLDTILDVAPEDVPEDEG